MIISLGEALIDFIGSGEIRFDGFPGGSPYNTSIAVSRLGIDCHFLGRVGTDLFGEKLVSYLEENGVATDLIVRTQDNSTLSFVEKDENGQPHYAFFANQTADRNWQSDDLEGIVLPEDAKIIHFGSISISQDPGGAVLTDFLCSLDKEMILSFDPNIRPSLIADREAYLERFRKLCSISAIVKLSDEDLEWLYPDCGRSEALQSIRSEGAKLVALTLGGEGTVLFNDSGEVLIKTEKREIADTIGAGDTFHGALLAYCHRKEWLTPHSLAVLSEEQMEEAGEFANRAAGINCERSGADPPYSHEMGW